MSDLDSIFTIFFFILGAIFGSFGNVLILRLPKKESIVPGSRCNHCGKAVRWFDNIPIFSWFILRGKCRECGGSFSFRYPFVELLTATLFMAAFLKLGWSWSLLEAEIFIFGLVVVTFIDFDHMILPDLFTLSGIVMGLMGALLNPEREFLSALLGVLLGGGFLWLTAYLYWLVRKEEGMGGGDIKLLAWIGAVLGAPSIPFVILVSSVFGSFVGLFFAIKTKGGLKVAIPFGPYLVFGALVYLFVGHEVADWYWSFFVGDLRYLTPSPETLGP